MVDKKEEGRKVIRRRKVSFTLHVMIRKRFSCTPDEKIQINTRFWPGLEILF